MAWNLEEMTSHSKKIEYQENYPNEVAECLSDYICNRLEKEWLSSPMQAEGIRHRVVKLFQRLPIVERVEAFQYIQWFDPIVDQDLYADLAIRATEVGTSARLLANTIQTMRKKLNELMGLVAISSGSRGRPRVNVQKEQKTPEYIVSLDTWRAVVECARKEAVS